jgi:hypothetical protein
LLIKNRSAPHLAFLKKYNLRENTLILDAAKRNEKKMINTIEQRVTNVLCNLKKREYQKKFLTKNTAFSRTSKQKMNFEEMTLFFLMDTGKSLSIELLNFFNELPQTRETITKQAFSKQRQFIDSELFEDLNKKYIQAVYNDRQLLFHKRLLVAVDGSTAEIPNVKELIKHYGSAKASDTSAQNARVGLYGFYDPLNHLLLQLTIDKYQKNETKAFMEYVASIKEQWGNKPLCFIFDRGYISLELLLELEHQGVDYLFRVSTNCYKEELESAKSNDEEINIQVTKPRLKNVDAEQQIVYLARKSKKERLVKVELDTGEIEYLITSIPVGEVSYGEMRAFYFQRWEIERVFNLLKNRLHVEDICARTVVGVEQEILATVFLGNIIEDIVVDVNKSLSQRERNKYRYFVNVNLLCGCVKNYFLLIYGVDGVDEGLRLFYYRRLVAFLRRTVIAKCVGRKCPRVKRVSRNKYRTNFRNSF